MSKVFIKIFFKRIDIISIIKLKSFKGKKNLHTSLFGLFGKKYKFITNGLKRQKISSPVIIKILLNNILTVK